MAGRKRGAVLGVYTFTYENTTNKTTEPIFRARERKREQKASPINHCIVERGLSQMVVLRFIYLAYNPSRRPSCLSFAALHIAYCRSGMGMALTAGLRGSAAARSRVHVRTNVLRQSSVEFRPFVIQGQEIPRTPLLVGCLSMSTLKDRLTRPRSI